MPGDIYPVNVSRRPHLICSAPSINHSPCCVPTDAGSEHTQQPAPRALREGAPRLHTQRSTQSFSLLCAGCSSTVGHAVASVPQISLPFPFSLWCSPPYPEERCAIRSNEGCAHLPTRSTPFGNLSSSHESLRAPLHVGQSLPLPEAFTSQQKPSGLAVPPGHLPKAPQLYCRVCLGALGTLLVLTPPQLPDAFPTAPTASLSTH